ncbi:MAG: helix-turn-helix domain-containing protein [Methylohalobius sp. ZOD2]|nr:helix-turn-helix domain-containing protein [Methylothermaceae bacterium]
MRTDILGILDRLRAIFGTSSDATLARALGVQKTTLSSWKARNSIPYEKCVQVAEEKGISLDWLLSGIGSMEREVLEIREQPPEYLSNPRREKLLALFDGLSEEQQLAILAVAEEKRRLSELERKLEALSQKLNGLNRI